MSVDASPPSGRDQDISSHYVNRLRDEIGLARHRMFLQQKYQWNDATWESLPWDSLAMCAKKTRDFTYALWIGRNDVLHEHSVSSQAILHASLNHDISQMYALRSSFSDILQSYFRLPLEDILRQTPRQRQRWLRLARLATSHSSAQGRRQQLLPLYFQYVTKNNSPCPPLPSSLSPLLSTQVTEVPFSSATDASVSS